MNLQGEMLGDYNVCPLYLFPSLLLISPVPNRPRPHVLSTWDDLNGGMEMNRMRNEMETDNQANMKPSKIYINGKSTISEPINYN